MNESLFKRLITKPPILFPLAALFHIVICLSAIVSLYPTELSQKEWARPGGMLLFSILSVFLCGMKKWAAIAYVLMSMLSLAIIYLHPNLSALLLFADSIFPFNVILSFFILLLFKRFK